MADPVFGVLGNLVVRGRSGEVAIGGRRRRGLLTYLLFHRGSRVSTDAVCDDLWAGKPPPSAIGTVRTYISQFRKLEVDGAGLTISADSNGYRVDVGPDDLDLDRFERLLADASSASGDERLARLEDALSLWRGPPAAEFAGEEWADREARRLELQCTVARQDRFGVLLELGRHDECLADLDAAVGAAPLDERFAALLALARYRAGDGAGALRTLASTRAALVDELGLSPGPEIDALETQILERDPALTLPPGAPNPRRRADLPTPDQKAPSPAPGAGELPTGTVTFLFTDIEGSTALLHRIGDEGYVEALTVHREILHDAIAESGGVVFGSEGDSVFAAFASASAAADAAVTAQRHLAANDWAAAGEIRVRMGIHTGSALLVDDDYAGATVHVAARVGASAHGGQIVASETTYVLAGAPGWFDLGLHRLKDVARPLRLYQVTADGVETAFPPQRTANEVPHNLSESVDAFIGRADDVDRLEELVADHRVVSIIGPGGVGKTRLVTEFGRSVKAAHPGGVFLVELVSTSDRSGIEVAIASAMELSVPSGAPLATAMETATDDAATLVLLDNCEHVLDDVASLVDEVVAASTAVTIVCTSREPLDVRGERVYRLAPLATETDGEQTSAAELLFSERAEAATGRPPSDDDVGTIRAICRELDGLPLAIELAASRCRGLAVIDILRRLEDRFTILRAGRDADDRHGTLEAVIAWSHESLIPMDRRLLEHAALLGEPFTLDAAEAVGGQSLDQTIDGLGRLVDKSLVQLDADGPVRGYRILESIRAYCRRSLAASDSTDDAEERVIVWALGWVERLEADMRTERQDESLRTVLAERATLRAAFGMLVDRDRHREALRVVSAAPIDIPAERVRRIDDLVALVDAPAVVGRAHAAASNLCFERSEYAASAAHGDAARLIFDELGDRRSSAWADFIATFSIWATGDEAAARAAVQRALATFRELNDEVGVANVSWCAALLEESDAAAIELADRAESSLRRLDLPTALAHCLEARALAQIRLGRGDETLEPLREALGVFASARNQGCTAHCLDAIAAAAISVGTELEVIAELLGAADEFRERSGHGHRPWELGGRQAASRVLSDALDPDDRDAAINRGREHTLASAAALAERVLTTAAVR